LNRLETRQKRERKRSKGRESFFAAILLAAGILAACSGDGTSPATSTSSPGQAEESQSAGGELSGELNVFNWSEYLPASVIQKFEEEYKVKLNYSTYSSNEEMLAKLSVSSGNYDIAVASDYMVDLMRKQGLLEEIDFSHIPNIKNIGAEFLNKPFDPEGKLSVPYMWGNVVIAVNTDKVKVPIESYRDLWRPELRNSLVVLDDSRTLIGIANKLQGKSMSETDPQVLEKTRQMLIELKPNIKAFDSDSPKTMLATGEATVGVVWGAEASLARRENPAVKTVLPKEGMQLWQDNFVIPKGAKNKRLAEEFINFILRPEISAEISKDFPYANPNIAAHELIDKEILEDPAVYPPSEELAKGEYLIDLGQAAVEFDRIWSEIKLE